MRFSIYKSFIIITIRMTASSVLNNSFATYWLILVPPPYAFFFPRGKYGHLVNQYRVASHTAHKYAINHGWALIITLFGQSDQHHILFLKQMIVRKTYKCYAYPNGLAQCEKRSTGQAYSVDGSGKRSCPQPPHTNAFEFSLR